MNDKNIDDVVKSYKERSNSMQRIAGFYFLLSLFVLTGSGILFFNIKLPIGETSDSKYLIEMLFSLFSRLTIIVISFYLVRLLMSVVSYNLVLSNDMYTKANILLLYNSNGTLKIEDLKQLLDINNHKFNSSKGFSGKDELDSLTKIMDIFKKESKKDN